MSDVGLHATQLLADWRSGDGSAAARLLPLVYDELRALAGFIFQQQHVGHTLQPTALVHEAYLRLVGSNGDLRDRGHFMSVAAVAMRQILSNHARDRRAGKRGGGVWKQVTLDQAEISTSDKAIDLVALDDALQRLASLSVRQARIVELRIFGGHSIEEAARFLDIGATTVKSDWQIARAWLKRELATATEA
jgi:RNA polymerase sigma factor (TIGR02999 family)